MTTSTDGFFEWLSSEVGRAAIAGALGGLVRTLALRENWREGTVSIIVGAICAVYIGPVAAELIDPMLGIVIKGPMARIAFSSFLVGFLGIAISGFIIDVWKARLASRLRKDDDGAPKP